jgi:hypothetical protein
MPLPTRTPELVFRRRVLVLETEPEKYDDVDPGYMILDGGQPITIEPILALSDDDEHETRHLSPSGER